MFKFLVKIYPWENPRVYDSEEEFKKGDNVIVETEFGPDLGEVVSDKLETKDVSDYKIERKAIQEDLTNLEKNKKRTQEVAALAKEEVKKLNIAMKIIDSRLAIDGSGVVIFFIADGRIDFRDLVKIISKKVGKSIRMQQIGSRDEARRLGGCGICGRELCCVRFSGNLPSISTEMARVQQVSQRGTGRISGLCGRLMCCLAYEAEQYRDLLVGMPELHSFIETEEGKGQVIEVNAITQEVRVKIDKEKTVTLKKDKLK